MRRAFATVSSWCHKRMPHNRGLAVANNENGEHGNLLIRKGFKGMDGYMLLGAVGVGDKGNRAVGAQIVGKKSKSFFQKMGAAMGAGIVEHQDKVSLGGIVEAFGNAFPGSQKIA